ncbi:MAG TPA: HIT domain-containing protein [Armatimonadota bacterium]
MADGPSEPERLHAPWRMEYVEKTVQPSGECIFCEKPRQQCDQANYIVYRGEFNYVILNVFPYNSGHLMVIPYQHTADLTELPLATQAEMMRLTTLAVVALKRVMRPDGFNVGMNIGRPAGAGIADHLHLHIVPRWSGDTNFMPVIGNTRVLPESLERTWEKIRAAFLEVVSEECG